MQYIPEFFRNAIFRLSLLVSAALKKVRNYTPFSKQQTPKSNCSKHSISKELGYSPYIDGLRAIAILFVLFFHGGSMLFPSGFIGVDIFFVISGFLITNIIYHSLKNDEFSFMQFYKRRLWRLQPAFIATIVVTCILTLLFYLPEDLTQYTKSARKTALFMSNIFFEKTTSGYFAPDVNQLPLLHTWSLAIEWQCYLLLPMLIYTLYRIIPEKWLQYSVYLLTTAGFILALYFSAHNPVSTYYQCSSRFFEFLAGSSIALFPRTERPVSAYFSLNLNLLTFMAFCTLFYIATRLDIQYGFPDWYALGVCLSTAIILLAGQFQSNLLIARVLSLKPLVLIGLISYSLYIWHWPILALMRYQNIDETKLSMAIIFCIIFFISWISWKYIEKPTRKLHATRFLPTILCLLITPIIITHSVDYFVKNHSGFPQRFNTDLVGIYEKLNQYKSEKRPSCIGRNSINSMKNCNIGSENPNSKKGFMIGDSFSNHYWGFMDVIGKQADISILVQGTSSCLALPGIYLYDWWHFKNQVYEECRDETARYFRMIQQNNYDYVIIGQAWGNYVSEHIIKQIEDERSIEFSKNRMKEALDEAIKIIVESGARPVLIKSTAVMQSGFHDCFFRNIKLRKPYDPKLCSFDLVKTEQEVWIDQIFETMQNKYSQLLVIDPREVQCKDGQCQADIHGVPIYRDVGHITDYASFQLGKSYVQTPQFASTFPLWNN